MNDGLKTHCGSAGRRAPARQTRSATTSWMPLGRIEQATRTSSSRCWSSPHGVVGLATYTVERAAHCLAHHHRFAGSPHRRRTPYRRTESPRRRAAASALRRSPTQGERHLTPTSTVLRPRCRCPPDGRGPQVNLTVSRRAGGLWRGGPRGRTPLGRRKCSSRMAVAGLALDLETRSETTSSLTCHCAAACASDECQA